jgi:SOS-response transcriptional repressor LexA
MTQQEFADSLRINRSYLSEIENGLRPSDKLRERIEVIEYTSASDSDVSRLAEEPSYGSDPRAALKRAREAAGLTPEELAKIARVPAQYIRDVEAGNVRGSNEKQLRKLAAALKLSPDALMSGSDHPPILGDHVATFGKTPEVKLTDNLTAKTIPLISMAQAGMLTEANFEDVYDYEGVIAYAGKDPRAFAVRIRGESMMPDYQPGTIAIVYPSHRAQNDNLVIAKLSDGSVLFKRVQFVDGEVIFHSINPNYPPMKYSDREIAWMYPVGLTQKVEL